MTAAAALQSLGSTRVIWIDDCFNDSAQELAKLLYASLDVTKACEFPELADAIAADAFDTSATVSTFTQALTDAGQERRKAIKAAFFEKEGKAAHFATNDLADADVQTTCRLLNIQPQDRWTFAKAVRHLRAICESGDETISYVVDLNESGGSSTQGLEILKELHQRQSKGTAFILTHDTVAAKESEKEGELRAKLVAEDVDIFALPVCVIAKERFKDDGTDPNVIENALKVGIKRAGLRRSLHEVVATAKDEASKSFSTAAEGLLSIPPEQLEKYVYERGYKEGVSELHVVERAFTAHFARHLRKFFGTNSAVQRSTKRLRGLRGIDLKSTNGDPDSHLMDFRAAELWETDELINQAMTPIACGDVFEIDPLEVAQGISKKYLLLGQPCDIALRPESKRQQNVAFLIPLKKKETAVADKPKEPILPFKLDGATWICEFRNAGNVNLEILDLASFRMDGRVRVDERHAAPPELLMAQQQTYGDRTAAAAVALVAGQPIVDARDVVNLGLQLTFGSRESFKHVQCATYAAASGRPGTAEALPNRVTWKLRRCGRLRMPYAAAMLDKYTAVIARDAFDLDYMSPGAGD